MKVCQVLIALQFQPREDGTSNYPGLVRAVEEKCRCRDDDPCNCALRGKPSKHYFIVLDGSSRIIRPGTWIVRSPLGGSWHLEPPDTFSRNFAGCRHLVGLNETDDDRPCALDIRVTEK